MLVGDFNSITSTADRVSGNLDPTSMVLQSLLDEVGLIEPGGSKCYTYQHPAIAQSKSCLDRICVSRDLAEAFYTYTQWCTFSDHSAVCLNRQRLVRGPTQWRMPDDVLEQKDFDTVIQEAIMDHGLVDLVLNWELTKASIKWSTQKKLEWVLQEGTGHPAVLHLEDENNFNLDIKQLKDEAGNMVYGDNVLNVLKDFYSKLYMHRPEPSHSEMQEFLCHIHNLPKVEQRIDSSPIIEQEVLGTIAKLRLGKSPGSDGLTAAFYKKFDHLLTPFLVAAFNSSLEQGSLAPSQRLAIIILLFKKGLEDEVANYHPISLTNVDYKILAYILTVQLSVCFEEIYHPSQTAYIPGRFISTNICKMQDVIDYSSKNQQQWVILFLDFQKAFDSVSHAFLSVLMIHMGFPPHFVVWIQLLYVNAGLVVQNHGWLSEQFALGRGV